LRGDLDWITLKALEKDRQRRYASASELAADLVRYRESRAGDRWPAVDSATVSQNSFAGIGSR
jgi:hypothetical protein